MGVVGSNVKAKKNPLVDRGLTSDFLPLLVYIMLTTLCCP